jgi:hypothetical protein
LEIIDASTTAAEEVITHSSRYPSDAACLACIYAFTKDEEGRLRDVAAGLGVTLDDVRKEHIDADAAARIASQHSGIDAEAIVGIAYDTLYKDLCSAQALILPGGEQVLAPFAFVSYLAGALMVIELLRFSRVTEARSPNYFFTNPWRSPYRGARVRKPKNPECEFCSNEYAARGMNGVWHDVLGS